MWVTQRPAPWGKSSWSAGVNEGQVLPKLQKKVGMTLYPLLALFICDRPLHTGGTNCTLPNFMSRQFRSFYYLTTNLKRSSGKEKCCCSPIVFFSWPVSPVATLSEEIRSEKINPGRMIVSSLRTGRRNTRRAGDKARKAWTTVCSFPYEPIKFSSGLCCCLESSLFHTKKDQCRERRKKSAF